MRKSADRIEKFSKISSVTGLSALGERITAICNKGYIRVVNYHHIPLDELDNFEKQIDTLSKTFEFADLSHLTGMLSGKIIPSKPSLLFTFDDGLESHATYVAELLTRKNIQGIFFVPTAAPDLHPDTHTDWAVEHQVAKPSEDLMVNGRVFADWRSWAAIQDKHIVATHTHEHMRFTASVSKNSVSEQLAKSYSAVKKELNIDSKIFCWVGGELASYSPQAASAIVDSGTELSFTTCSQPTLRKTNPLRIERTNIESFFSLERTKLSVSGIVDLRYYSKRYKLNSFFNNIY